MQTVEGGIILFDTIYIGNGEIPSGVVLTLRIAQGEAVVYHKDTSPIIDYPGEYELSGYNVVCFVSPKSTKLNYIIRFLNKKIAYIQENKAFDNDEISDMDTWYVINENLKDIIERRELGGSVMIVE